jgi:hypothetical protein
MISLRCRALSSPSLSRTRDCQENPSGDISSAAAIRSGRLPRSGFVGRLSGHLAHNWRDRFRAAVLRIHRQQTAIVTRTSNHCPTHPPVARAQQHPSQRRTTVRNRASRNSPSLAVALNCGMGSSSLNADVNGFERLQIVRGWNSSYLGSKYRSCTVRARCFGASSLPSTNAS